MMPVSSRLLCILLISFCTTAQALERRYLASMEDSQWKLTANSTTLCRIEHQIPRFGSAVFSQQAGRDLRLELVSRRKFKQGINVELRSETTSWNANKTRTVLARFETSGSNKLFKVPVAVAEQVFFELRDGYQPGFLFYQDYPMVASLSNVRFGEADAQFGLCVEQLYGDNFSDVRISTIHFEPDSEFPSLKEEQKALKRMLNYLQVDNAVSEIVVTGHTDNTGLACYNEGLSERRAWYVYDLLIARGIDSNLLRVDYQGEQKPVSKDSKDSKKSSLANNRRVTVELRR
jgi:outer membrane protein OmpA-like peptidoglycan-associated protein